MIINKYDYIFLFIILILLICGVVFSYGNIISVYSDISREYYIPWQMNEGNVLYKDIFNVYAPLGYQINALVLHLFNNKIYSLYIMGFLFSFFALSAVYLITKLYTDKFIALTVSVLVLYTCTLYQSISNWIVPYSYSVLYAMSAFLFSFLFMVLFLKNNNIRNFLYACFFIGVSCACKYEYGLFVLIIIAAALYKKIGIKNSIYAFIIFSSVPVFSLSLLIYQGCSAGDLINALKYIFSLSSSESLKYFYGYAGFIPSFRSIIGLIIGSLINNSMLFIFIGYLSIVSLLLFKRRSKLQMFLNITAIAVSVKCICSISLELYGTFFLPILFINMASLLNKERFKLTEYITVLILILCIAFYYAYIDINAVIKNRQNIIYATDGEKITTNNKYFADRYNDLIKYINENTKKTDKILVLPEGAFINFITKRQSDNMLYYLIPPNVEIFTIEKIIKRLESNPPEYIIMFYNKYPWYNTTSFANGYGKDIQEFINKHYIVEETASSDYDKVYTLKENINE